MRKGQIKLVAKAKLSGFSDEQVKLVEESTLALDDLRICHLIQFHIHK